MRWRRIRSHKAREGPISGASTGAFSGASFSVMAVMTLSQPDPWIEHGIQHISDKRHHDKGKGKDKYQHLHGRDIGAKDGIKVAG